MRFFIWLILFSIYYNSYSQPPKISDPEFVYNNIKRELIELKIEPDTDTVKFPFSTIKVIDKRYDTAAIGYLRYDNLISKEYYKLITKSYLSSDLESFINTIYKKRESSNSSLLIEIRKFWFDKNYDFNSSKIPGNLPPTYYFTLGIDFFSYSNNEFLPLIKKDTVIEVLQKRKPIDKGVFIGNQFNNVFAALIKEGLATIAFKRRKLTYTELNEYYNKRFREAILIDRELKKGVYKNFDEFKKNSPSNINFEIRKTDLADDIFIIDGENSIPARDAWGYCDGKNLFIKLGTNLFQLYRQGNSYSLLGNHKLTHSVSSYNNSYNDMLSPGANLGVDAIGNLLFSKNKFKLELLPLQLDMESGKVY